MRQHTFARTFSVLAGLAVFAALGLAGCTSADSDLQQFIHQTEQQPGGRVEPLPEIKPYETFVYSASEMRSPFLPSSPGSGAGLNGVRPDQKRNREFLEQYSLDTLKMVGTLRLGGSIYGLVQTKDGLVHRVTAGNHIGQAEGKITEISPSKISLIEIVPDSLGGYMERPAALALNE
ncbi:MAG TPA: pilus assembly protein PilP [Steroidobacteraceae bacterium]|nr:pilus assembly protein PilP [Steroidobacteraceae bacterium]